MATSGQNAAEGAAPQPANPEEERQAAAPTPAAGAHAAGHLTNDEATPGSGALTSRAHVSGKEVDGGAG